MKTTIKILAAALLLIIPFAGRAQKAENVNYTLAKNYFAKQNALISEKKINSQTEFNRHFSPAAVMGENGKPTPIDFTKQFVVAIVGTPTDYHTEFEITGITAEGNELTVSYTVHKADERQTYQMIPQTLIVLDGKYARHNVNFSATTVSKVVASKK